MAIEIKDGPAELDMLDWLSRTALEYIGQGGIGHTFNVFGKENETSEYTKSVKHFL